MCFRYDDAATDVVFSEEECYEDGNEISRTYAKVA